VLFTPNSTGPLAGFLIINLDSGPQLVSLKGIGIPSATCSDGIKDGGETDVDCGGSCPSCAMGQACQSNSDCITGLCDPDAHTCTSACTPRTCAQLGFNCGAADDGCGGQLTCGTCTAPSTCGGGGVTNVCGSLACSSNADCPAGQMCAAMQGVCVAACTAPDILCGLQCVNPSSDPANCGECGISCSPTQACVNGTCVTQAGMQS
jgi:hypothetical protein